jgi:hypothetical protein
VSNAFSNNNSRAIKKSKGIHVHKGRGEEGRSDCEQKHLVKEIQSSGVQASKTLNWLKSKKLRY